MGAFIHLHCHSAFSLLDGLGSPSKWVAAAAEKGFPALAITDHGSVSGAVELFKAGKQHGIQTMVGCEFYCVDDVSFRLKKGEKRQEQIHLTVIAKTFSGLQSIFEHLSLANRQFYFKPIIGLWDQIYDFKDCIVMTACAFGILSHEKHGELVGRLHQAYGDDFYLEIMPHDFEMQKQVNATAQVLSKYHGIKLVATNDAHYPNADDVDVHDAMLAIQTGASLSDPKRFSFKEGGLTSLYMANLEEMCSAFSPWVDRFDISQETVVSAFQATYEIAEKCRGFDIPKLDYALPSLYEDERDKLVCFCLDGLRDRVAGKVTDLTPYTERLQYELSVIGKLGVEQYLLMAHEFVNWARSEGILCGFGRGSAGGSLVCYLLWITGLDPIKFNLSFERFLNPDRIDLPDIDMDFAALDRDRVIEHIKEKYGPDHVAQISTVSKLHGKGAFRDICRVLDVPMMEVNRLAKYIDDETPLEEIVGLNAEMKAFTERYPKLPEYLVKLGGQIRSRSQHAGGVIVSSDGFDGRAVIESRKGDSALAVNWTMSECDHMGLLKFDILGLDNISVLKNAADMVKERTGKEIDYFEIEPNDPEVLKEFSDGNTGGFFQFEGDGMTSVCTGVAPITAFEDLIQVAALYRPGPLDSGMVQSFIKRKKGEEPISYLHPKEAEITKPTRGLLIFQEQVAALFVELAGFTKAEADKMRKIISKKLGMEEFEKYREAWLKGCAENTPDLDPAIASGLFDSIVKFASYSFNKSHSACYAYIAYLNAYMKHYHPTEFCAGLLQCKVGKTEKVKRYVQECKRLGIEVMPPDINFSDGNFRVTGDKRIHAGFRSVKGIAEKATVEILKARQTGGGFIDFKDFLLKTERRTINKRVIEALAYCGAFTSIEKNTKWIVTNYEALSKGRATVEIPDFSWKEIQTLKADMLPGIFNGDEIDVKAKLVIEPDILDDMIDGIKACKACELSQSHYCTAPVPFCYRPKSKLMLVAEAPGKDEDKKGDEPLVGDAGRRMEELFKEELNITTKRQLKANVFNCRPVNNKLSESVIAECVCGKLWLDKLIKASEPEVIFAMGAVPLRFFTGQTKGITRVSGEAIWHPDYKCMVVYSVHPASCLKFRDEGGERTAAFRKALQKLKAFL